MHPHNPHLADEEIHKDPVVDLLLDGYTGLWVTSGRIDTMDGAMEGSGSDPIF
jgi:hypothetical protein